MSASLEQLLRDARIDLVLSRIEKDESVIKEVIQNVESNIRSIKFNSILVLGEIGEKSGSNAVPVITSCLKDDDWSIRREAARSLGKIGRSSQPAITELSSLISDEESTIRLAVVSSLGLIGKASPESINTLKKGLKDKNELVRAEAAKAIGLFGAEAFDLIPDLMNGLKDPNWIVRVSSAHSISDIGKGTVKTIPTLIQALEDKDWRVRYRVVDTLTQIGEPSISGLLNVFRNDFLKAKDDLYKSIKFGLVGAIKSKAHVSIGLLYKKIGKKSKMHNCINLAIDSTPQFIIQLKNWKSYITFNKFFRSFHFTFPNLNLNDIGK